MMFSDFHQNYVCIGVVCSVQLLLNRKNVVTLKHDCDHLMLMSFSNSLVPWMNNSVRLVLRYRNQVCSNLAIDIKDITNIHVTRRLEVLHQGDQQYCQYQKSKKNKGK